MRATQPGDGDGDGDGSWLLLFKLEILLWRRLNRALSSTLMLDLDSDPRATW
jgi:hypothetical protein